MAKIVRKKRRKLRLEGVAVLLFSASLICLLISSLFINTINTSLTMKIQNTTDEINRLKNENYSLNVEIQGLQNKERVFVIAESAGLNQNQDNVISVNSLGE
ncbi:MAG: hypothetical protein PUD22_00790 [Erysipelotrichaceae bacterium]|nr:hypothetical protein [Erysipelotrichaceae bacterium]